MELFMDSWLHEQTDFTVAQWDKSIETHYPGSVKIWSDPKEHVLYLTEYWNTFEAVKLINWKKYFAPAPVTVIDIGGGTGWLSAYLSAFDEVKAVTLLDSSKAFLTGMYPGVCALLGGRPEKIRPVQALFTPLLEKDNCVDIVVASSALHHADSLETVLAEINRVLKPGGYVFVLNEFPLPAFLYLAYCAAVMLNHFKNLLFFLNRPLAPYVLPSGFMYNAALGDRHYALWQWRRAFKNAGFKNIEVFNTGLPVGKNGKGRKLSHFIARKNP